MIKYLCIILLTAFFFNSLSVKAQDSNKHFCVYYETSYKYGQGWVETLGNLGNYPWTYIIKSISPISALSVQQIDWYIEYYQARNDELKQYADTLNENFYTDYISYFSLINECELSVNTYISFTNVTDSKGVVLFESGTHFNVSEYGSPLDLNTINPISGNLPKITLNGSLTVNHPVGWEYKDDGATASNADGDSISVNISGSVDSDVIGTYFISYTASDENGNEALPITRTVNIVEGNLLDSDIDGINDAAEITNGLNPFDSTDAFLDRDNDGVSNVDEINAGSDINVDDQPPVFTSFVDDLEVISTGLSTTVELVNPSASDFNSDVVVTNDSDGEFPVGITTVTYTATDASGNSAVLTQQINVLPYIVISPGQSLGDGQSLNVTISLNVTPASYPVTGELIVRGTASSDDFTLSTTTVSIIEGLTQTIELTAVDDGFGESDETVILSLANLVGAGIKTDSDNERTFTITEESVLPTLSVSVEQNDVIGRIVGKQSEVRFNIDIEDPNGLDSLTIEWSGIEGLTEVAKSNDLVLDPSAMTTGVYVLNLSVTDNDVAGDNVINQLITIKVIDALPELTTVDSDGDGVTDIEEGLGDSDNDGIADYLDNTPQINLQPIGETFAQAQDGVTLALGASALAGDNNSISIAPSSLPEDTTYEVKEVFDFTLTGLAIGASYELVLPLSQVIPEDAIYRKLTDDGWVDFVEDADNAVHSVFSSGECPAINSDLWVAGLITGGNCIKLTIQDGSSNDTDGLENGTVEDPSGIAVVKQAPAPTPTPTTNPTSPSSSGGSSGGSTSIEILMLLWLVIFIRRLVNRARY